MNAALTSLLPFTPLLGLLLKSSLIAIAGLSATRLIARRPADRVDILRVTLILVLALPVAGAFAPALRLDVLPGLAPETASLDPLWSGTAGPVAGVEISGDILWPSPMVVLGWLWAVGALVVVGRLIIGLWTLGRWTREARPVRSANWTEPLARLATTRRPALLASDRVSGPLSWGLPPGAILIDTASLAAPEAASAILAHEMAHVRRHDWAFLMLSRLVVALFWFNPLVWKVHADLAAASEDAADAEAVRHVDRHAYARTLIGLAADPRSAPSRFHGALGMAADPRTLKRRISRIMTQTSSRRRPLAIGLTMAALVAVATPLAALELHSRDIGFPTPPAPPSPVMIQIAEPLAPPALPQAPEAPEPPTPPSISGHYVVMTDGAAPYAPPTPPTPPSISSRYVMTIDGAFPPAPPAPPQAPVPPVPPSFSGHYWVTDNGVTREATPEERAAAEQARAGAREARIQAREARRVAAVAREGADEARVHARAALARTGAARAGAEAGRGHAEQARVAGRAARERARIDVGAQMRVGADQMRRGAGDMRRDADKFNDPAYRAQMIEEARGRGQTLTDAQLQAIGPRLRVRADELEQRAARLASRNAEAN